jgi:hypothetical protein
LGLVIGLKIGVDGIEEIDAQMNPDRLAYLQNQLADPNHGVLS